MTRGARNCNPLNIRRGSNWKGLRPIQNDKDFAQFESMQWGYRAAFVLLCNYITKHKCITVEKIISRWAPSNENNTQAYIKYVCLATRYSPDRIISPTFDDLSLLVLAMAWIESKEQPLISLLRHAWDLK